MNLAIHGNPMNPSPLRTLTLLEMCQSMNELHQIHAQTIITGLIKDTFTESKIVSFSLSPRRGNLCYGRSIYDQIEKPNSFIWYAMIRAYFNDSNSHEAISLFNQMLHFENLEYKFSVPFALKACGELAAIIEGKQIHGWVLKNHYNSDVFVLNALLKMYVDLGEIRVAGQVFDRMDQQDLVSWTTMIHGYMKFGELEIATNLFNRMPNRDKDSVTWNAMIDGYVKYGNIKEASKLFEGMPDKTLVSWNLIIDGYAKGGDIEMARKLFNEMPKRDVISWNSMVDGYVKCRKIEEAKEFFDRMPQKDVVSWTIMIAGYVHNDLPKEALKLFQCMLIERERPDEATLASILMAISSLGLIEEGKWVHSFMGKHGFKVNGVLGSALIDMYSKCGYIEPAHKLFTDIVPKTLGHWNAMISGFAMHGLGKIALELFKEMERLGVKPNAITFIAILSACSHSGMVSDGLMCFQIMRERYALEPKIQHYGCIVDLLARAGMMKEALRVIEGMPMNPDSMMWKVILSACRKHGEANYGESATEKLMELEPNDASIYVLLSNIYAMAGRWEDVARTRMLMRERGLRKTPGCSSIVIGGVLHEFLAGGDSHPQYKEIVSKVGEVIGKLRLEGYRPDLTQVLLDVEVEEKENSLGFHSEKLAISFGLINTKKGMPIHVIKNLRVCGDCHSFIKLLSMVYDHEIVVRDQNRFHHFKNGSCSCMDFW
ncbi:hypothetical protein AMTRI_Chr11g96040 [Amborella trichopoda]